jgi:hemerythrin-like domain-containing protein
MQHSKEDTLWLFNIAMENGPFIDGLPIKKMVIFHGYVK